MDEKAKAHCDSLAQALKDLDEEINRTYRVRIIAEQAYANVVYAKNELLKGIREITEGE